MDSYIIKLNNKYKLNKIKEPAEKILSAGSWDTAVLD